MGYDVSTGRKSVLDQIGPVACDDVTDPQPSLRSWLKKSSNIVVLTSEDERSSPSLFIFQFRQGQLIKKSIPCYGASRVLASEDEKLIFVEVNSIKKI